MQTELAELAPATLINHRYRVERPLGRGASGHAYVVWDLVGERRCALKLFGEATATARVRLRREFGALSAVQHPHLVAVYDLDETQPTAGVPGGLVFYTAELCVGGGVAHLRNPQAPREERALSLARLIAEVGAALASLHARGLVHRDVKPDNILSDDQGHFRLGDLGSASVAAAGVDISGTPAYLAPEVLRGDVGPAADVYGLGATAWACWAGRAPRQGTLLEILQASFADLPRLDTLPDPAPTRLADLVAALTTPSAADRWRLTTALEAARQLGAGLATDEQPPATSLAQPPLLEREAALAAAAARLAEGGLLTVTGPPGCGRSRLVRTLRDQLRLATLAAATPLPRWLGPTWPDVWRGLGLAEEAISDRTALGRLAAACAERATVIHLDAEAPSDLTLDAARLAAHGGLGLGTTLVLETGGALPEAGEAHTQVAVAPLSQAAVTSALRAMTGDARRGVAATLWQMSAGVPAVLVPLIAELWRDGPPTEAQVAASVRPDVLALLTQAHAALPSQARTVLAAAAVLGPRFQLEALAAVSQRDVMPHVLAARAAGWLVDDGADERFVSQAHLEVCNDAAGESLRRQFHQRALTHVGDDARGRARHLDALGDAGAAAAWLDVARRELALGLLLAADGALGSAAACANVSQRELARLTAEVRLKQARYPEALSAARHAALAGDVDAELIGARALQRAGRFAEAEQALAPHVARDDAAGREARALLARILVATGRLPAALALTRPRANDLPHAALDEACGLAALYLGRHDEAQQSFLRALRAAGDDPIAVARAQSLLGMHAQAVGALSEAATRYQAALQGARRAGDLHAAATYAANLAGVYREQGELALAVEPSLDAVRTLTRLGKRPERALALFNHGNLLLTMGALDDAEPLAAAALAAAPEAPRECGYAALLLADIAERRGDDARARAHLGQALERLQTPADRAVGLRALAELELRRGALPAAELALADARRQAELAGQPALVLLTQGRLAHASGRRDAALTSALGEQARADERALRRQSAFRYFLLNGLLLLADNDALAKDAFASAQRIWEEMVMRTPELDRARMQEDPDARKLRALLSAADGAPANQVGSALAEEAARWRRLAAINKRLNSEVRLDRLLEIILDTVLDLTQAERCFVLLGEREFRVAAARNIDAEQLRHSSASFSRSIAEQAARQSSPIVTVDAQGDVRFEAALSVSDLKLRSVLAVPLAVKGRSVGCIYADHRMRAGLFSDSDVALCTDLAEQAAIAIENARLLEDNERQRQAVAALNHELEERVAHQSLELNELQREVRRGRAALTVRYDYQNIIGRTAKMGELFRLVDRVTDTALPVVIYGESGTGKELIARAIHHNGPRRDKPFISESCGAIPETLLEAALFGHVRGSFTGADSDRRGLFEVAHGGTLFLDEVGEMPPAMQVKLLRVLTTSEFRRIGGEKTIHVDVRIVVASNRDLGKLVEEGRFREDLFYRLNVVRVALPALRDRRDDIPLLVEHFLRKHAPDLGGQVRRIERAALMRLYNYRWPGNVRELENEVLRAAALSDGVIRVEDLSPQVNSGDPSANIDSPENLDLRHRVERLEQTLLKEALVRADGNQSQAARLLGLSRFGLQKKLRRYQLS